MLQAGSRHACAAASPARAAGLAAGEGRGGGAKNPKGRQRAAVPTQLRREAKLEPSGSGPKPVGTFTGGRGKEKQYDFMLTVQSLGRKNHPLVSKGLGLRAWG